MDRVRVGVGAGGAVRVRLGVGCLCGEGHALNAHVLGRQAYHGPAVGAPGLLGAPEHQRLEGAPWLGLGLG